MDRFNYWHYIRHMNGWLARVSDPRWVRMAFRSVHGAPQTTKGIPGTQSGFLERNSDNDNSNVFVNGFWKLRPEKIDCQHCSSGLFVCLGCFARLWELWFSIVRPGLQHLHLRVQRRSRFAHGLFYPDGPSLGRQPATMVKRKENMVLLSVFDIFVNY